MVNRGGRIGQRSGEPWFILGARYCNRLLSLHSQPRLRAQRSRCAGFSSALRRPVESTVLCSAAETDGMVMPTNDWNALSHRNQSSKDHSIVAASYWWSSTAAHLITLMLKAYACILLVIGKCPIHMEWFLGVVRCVLHVVPLINSSSSSTSANYQPLLRIPSHFPGTYPLISKINASER